MENRLKNNGEFVTINEHNIHIYRRGNKNKPKIVFMSGSGTVAPVYDFKVLYEKLLDDFRIIVIEKFGYGYSDIVETPCDIDSLPQKQCPKCGMMHDFDYPKCPFCKYNYYA